MDRKGLAEILKKRIKEASDNMYLHEELALLDIVHAIAEYLKDETFIQECDIYETYS